jgi:ABC-2 type transport system ATP-binding protein
MIKVDRLTRKYGSFTAVDDISFVAEPGRVTGFLGPNGAGKTTTMRVMVGLTPATHGTVTIGGHDYKEIPNPGRHVGVLLDASAQHAGRTGREVLTIGARTMGLPDSRVDEMLNLVSLSEREAKRRVRNYSLGMRQRLGIAHALLGDPQVLILDEPANGLDPAGIRWMRGLLKQYAERGGTVLLSSHLLNEVQLIADDIVMIGRGRIVAQGTPESLLQDSGTFVRAVESDQLAAALEGAGIAVTPHNNGLRAEAEALQVGKVAAAHTITLIELRPSDGGLEDLFLELTADAQRDDLTEGAAQ